ncbi:EAL domain-containing protein [Chitinimonas koreensis]|uniref:EAL domain-containing protein n=1 Tax=Chitinimonas koreensis TaxID=356302 RepID=UPI000409C062|nr:EAL domain-containing protein [Chitinimonas koreensis]
MTIAAFSVQASVKPLSRLRSWLMHISMRQVFVLVVAAGLLVPGVLFTLVTVEWRRAELTRQFHAEQVRVLEILALGLRQPLWDLSFNAGQPLVDTAMKDTRIVSVRVDGSFPGEPFISVTRPERRLGRSIRLARPVYYGKQVIGQVSVEFDDGDLDRRLRVQARESVLMIGIELAVSLLLILTLLDSRFLGPLKRLSLQARAMASGEAEAVPAWSWTRGDEIGDLGRQLEWARGELHRLISELNDKNDALELDIAERMETEAALRASEAKYRELFVSNLDGICVVDLDGRVLDANPAMLALLGIGAETLVGQRLDRYVLENWRAYDNHMIEHRVLIDGRCGEYEIELRRGDGELLPVSAKGVLMRDGDGRAVGVWRILRDLTERKAAAVRMELAAKVFDNTAEAIMVITPDARIASVNRAFTDILGYAADEIVGQMVSMLRDPEIDSAWYDEIRTRYLEDGDWRGEVPLRRHDGKVFTAWMQINVVRDVTGRIGDVVALVRDISEAKATQARVLHLARFDALTELPNRAYFCELTGEAVAEAKRHNERRALLFVDLDHFKTINDSLGHAVGDLLLQGVARRLNDAIRAGDVVGRLGGDEFVILLRNLDSGGEAAYVAERVLAQLALPFQIGEHELVVTPSLGIALYPDDGGDYDALIRNADAAMYHAKANGRNTYRFYTADMNARAREILVVENQLRRALERNEFVLHYQPQADMETGRIVGAEALIRWRHPERGLVGPMQFIPIAEERGLIGAIGQWVLREACRQNREWQDAGLPPIEVAVNLSAMQFYQQALVDDITGLLRETGLQPRWLALEVTESVIVQDVESTIATLAALKTMGLKLAIDDFGTGYSSLNYLKRFKVDKLKIDRSFVMDVPGDADDSAITRAVVSLAHNLGLQVIAEGVETAEQWAFLEQEECDEVQGYLLSPPLPAAELARMLAHGSWRPPK